MPADEFGFDVSIAGNLIVVGAPWEDSSVDGSGGAFVFSRDGETWRQQEFLKSSEPKYNEALGWAVSASEFSLAVGCPWWSDESSSPSKNFRIPSMSEASSGDAAYIFIDPSAPRPTAVANASPNENTYANAKQGENIFPPVNPLNSSFYEAGSPSLLRLPSGHGPHHPEDLFALCHFIRQGGIGRLVG